MITATVIILLILLIVLISKYHWLSLAHPGVWFVGAWAVALSAYYLEVALDTYRVYDFDRLENLLSYVSVTAFGFLLAVVFIRGKVGPRLTDTSELVNAPGDQGVVLGLFALLSLAASLLNWLALGADLSGIESRRQAWLISTPVVTARLWYPYMLAYPAALAAGWRISTIRFGNPPKKMTIFLFACPIVSGFLWTLGTGGRQALGIVLLYYMCGFVLGWASNIGQAFSISFKKIGKVVGILLAVAIAFAFMVNLTGTIRAEYQGSSKTGLQDNPILAPFAQFIDYMGISLATYQVKGGIDGEFGNYGVGQQTFGVLDSIGVGYLLGWPNRSRADELAMNASQAAQGQLFAYATTTAYFNIKSDFGNGWGLVVSFALAVISHCVFTQWVKRPERRTIIPLAPLVITLMFWGYSHQYSILMYDVFKWMVISFIVWDLAAYALTENKAVSKQHAQSQAPW